MTGRATTVDRAEISRISRPLGKWSVLRGQSKRDLHVRKRRRCSELPLSAHAGFLARTGIIADSDSDECPICSSKLHGLLPDWYHTAYHSREYVMRTFSSSFRVLAYMETGLGNQDLVVLER